MPKVTDNYLLEKRKFILERTEEIIKEKPLYLITMRDIIKKAEFSQGVIYRYYANVDEIYVDFINKHTVNILLEERIDALLRSNQEEKTILSECFLAIGEYIEELMKSAVGKTFFELTILYAYDAEKQSTIFPKLMFKKSLEYAQQEIVKYVLANVERGIFTPQIAIRSIILFVSSSVDGIAQSVAINGTKKGDEILVEGDIPEMFGTLAKAVINFLEPQNK